MSINNANSCLNREHQKMLFEESGISPEIVAERGYGTVRSRTELLDFKKYQRRPGLVIPVSSPSGAASRRLRPDRPRKGKDGKPRKYEQPADTPNMLDVHPQMLEEARSGAGDLWVTEGEKKADSLTSRGLCTVALFGVWGWCVKGTKGRALLPCWDHVRLRGRRVYVVFDRDVMEKEGVQLALERFVPALETQGAEVLVVYLPGPEKGVDDYLVAGHTVAELKMLARKFEPADFGRIRLSRDEKLRALVEDLERRWWAEEWKGRGGHSDRDIALQLIEAAVRCGKIHADGLRVRVSWGRLQVGSKVARRTLAKALVRLEERGFLYRDNEGRKADKAGAFVLRAKVDQYGERDASEGKVTQRFQASDPGGLLSQVPRLRWSRPKYTPKRGTVAGTRKVRESKPPAARERIERLGKIRGAVVDALVVSGGSCTLAELCEALHRKCARDLRRRILPMLEDARILTVEGDAVTLADNWREALDEAREIGGELEADETARRDLEKKRKGYHGRHKVKVSPHYVNAGADGHVEELQSDDLDTPADRGREPEVLTLAAAVRSYLDRNPHDACQPPGWIGSTLWAFELFDGKPTPAETRAAIDELGGERFLRDRLERAREVVA